MDEVVDSLIHELSETVTDPDLSAWYTSGGAEVGDLCNFIYGPTFLAPNGSHANHTFGGLNYLAQEYGQGRIRSRACRATDGRIIASLASGGSREKPVTPPPRGCERDTG